MADISRTLEIILQFRDKLTAGSVKALAGLKSFSKKAGDALGWVTNAVFSIKTALIGLGAYLAGRFLSSTVKGVADLGREFVNLNATTGMSVKSLSELKFIAEQSGLGFEDLMTSIKTMQKNLEMFAMGGGRAKAAIDRMSEGFQSAARSGTPVEELLPMLIDEFEKMGTAQERVFVASKLFGDSGPKLLRFLGQGKDGFEQLREESHKLLVTWTDLEAQSGDKFVSAFDRLKSAISGVLDTGIKAILPTMTEWLDKLKDLIVTNQPMILNFFASILRLAAEVAPKIEEAFRAMANSVSAIIQPFLFLEKKLAQHELANAAEELQAITDKIAKGRKFVDEYGGAYYVPNLPADKEALKAEWQAAWDKTMAANERLKAAEGFPVAGGTGAISTGLSGAAASLEKRAAEIQSGITVPTLANRGGGAKTAPGYTPPIYTAKTSTDLLDSIHKLKNEWTDLYLSMQTGILGVANSLADNLTTGFMDVITGAKNFKDAVKGMAKSILTDIGQIIIKLMIMRTLGFAMGAIMGGGGTAAASSGSGAGAGMGGETLEFMARGTPRTTGPVIAGEEGSEAIIPLPDGRRVPVEMRGGGTTIIQYIQIDATDAQSFNEKVLTSMGKNRKAIGDLAVGQYQTRPALRRKYA